MAPLRPQIERLLVQYAESRTGEEFYMAVLNLLAAKHAVSKPKCAIRFNYETVMWEGITRGDLNRWGEAYPAVNLEVELKKMKEWILNAGANGHKTQWGRFITNWLSRAQNRGGK